MSLDLSATVTYVAALSVATERVTEMIKNIPGVSNFLSTRTKGTMEDVRLICVHLTAVLVGILLCYAVPALAPDNPQIFGSAVTGNKVSTCILSGLLASGGSAFWNSALDTFRSTKQQAAAKVPAPAAGGN